MLQLQKQDRRARSLEVRERLHRLRQGLTDEEQSRINDIGSGGRALIIVNQPRQQHEPDVRTTFFVLLSIDLS